MDLLSHWLSDYGLTIVFINVLLAQLGLPLPAYPVLIATGAMSAHGQLPAPALLATAIAACLVADLTWYAGGARYGGKMIRQVCRVSISPDSCVRQTESLFERFGARSLLVAKLIPGFGAIATALSGDIRMSLATFLLFDAGGAALYCGIGIGFGMIFADAVGQAAALLAAMGRTGVLVIAAAFALFVAAKWWQRHRLIKELRMARISVDDLRRLIDGGSSPLIVDVRSEGARRRDGAIPGAVPWPAEANDERFARLPRDAEVVVYCACPNEVSAARVARALHLAGFKRVRPLQGGIEAWIDAGNPVARAADGQATDTDAAISSEAAAETMRGA
ncbi:MAG TPA: rhodanese-like domain-containing protein [Caldimonas sp.]|nr:rhodanese-like domain-containing protein [Caldimonas sp.]HEX4234778.1 rhodanese-like domain-containing protein [Caldimonas sp.]